MKNLLILLMVLFVTACGRNQVQGIDSSHMNIPAEMRNDFEYFLEVCSEYPEFRGSCVYVTRIVSSVTYTNYEEGSHVIGTCYKFSDGDKSITISEEYYKTANPTDRRQLLVHELLHCVSSIGHTNETKLMSPWHQTSTFSEIDTELRFIFNRGF